MSSLFGQVYLDEDVSILVATLLISRGFSAQTTRDVGLLGKGDDEQLRYATEHEMVMVTHNRKHFEILAQEYFAAGRRHSGIIIAVRRSPHEIAQRLLNVLNAQTADELENQLIYI